MRPLASQLDVLYPAEPKATVDLPHLELLPQSDRDEGHRLDDDLAHENRRAHLVERRRHLCRNRTRERLGVGEGAMARGEGGTARGERDRCIITGGKRAGVTFVGAGNFF